MSYVEVTKDPKDKLLLKDFIDTLGAEIIGDELMEKYGTWPMYSKFFDFVTPLFFHMHLTDDKAANVGRRGNRSPTTSPLPTTIMRVTSPTPTSALTPASPRRMCGSVWKTSPWRTTVSLSCPAPSV